ncbi:transposase [Methylococcus sp. Mc7]|uniref:transposase n=1 Tax=Methylococcus sp. Mc7 TaxID=2860258 RepID=UPI0021028AD4|nr:transposase [Methylococcus sp. Mc7]
MGSSWFFWLAYKRLEKGRFRNPVQGTISRSDLLLLLEGVDLSVVRLREVRAGRVG